MAINVVYPYDVAQAGSLAYQAGRGQFQQVQDRQALAEAELALRRDDQSLRRDMAVADQYNKQRELGFRYAGLNQNAEQFGAQLAQQQWLSQLQGQYGLAREQLDQQGQLKQQEATGQRALRKDLLAIQDKHLQRQWDQGMADATRIENFNGWRSPDQKEEAKQQWVAQYGSVMGEYPFNTPLNQTRPIFSAEMAKRQVMSALGDAYNEGYESMMGHDENGEWVWDMDPVQRNAAMKIQLDAHDKRAQREIAREQVTRDVEKRDYEIEQDRIDREIKRAQDATDQQQALQLRGVEAELDLNMELNKAKLKEFQNAMAALTAAEDDEDKATIRQQLQDNLEMLNGLRTSLGVSEVPQAQQQQGLPSYSREQAANAKKGEKFLYNGAPVVALGNGQFEDL